MLRLRDAITTESCNNGAMTPPEMTYIVSEWGVKLYTHSLTSRMNVSGYVGHVTIFSWTLTTACCDLMSSI